MTLFIFLVLLEIATFIWTIVTKSGHVSKKPILRGGELLLLLLLLLSGYYTWGSRYYIITGVLLLQAGLGLLSLKKAPKPFRIKRQTGILTGNLLLYFLALSVAMIFPEYKPLAVTGSHSVKTAEYTWTDESRLETFTDTGENRQLTIKIWYPADGNEKYPLILFSHGAFGVIDSNTSTCTELASHGYVAVSIAHPYHAMFVEDTNGKMTFANTDFVNDIYAVNAAEDESIVYAQSLEWMALRCADENFVLDTLLAKAGEGAEAPFSLIDREKIGLFGHSMGGASSVGLGRTRSDIGAVISLESTMFTEYSGFENGTETFIQEPYPVPILDVYSKQIYDLANAYPKDSFINFFMGARALCYDYVIFKDAGHLNFTDLPVISPFLAGLLGKGTVDARSCIENVNSVVLNFFDHYLKGSVPLQIQREY